MPATLSLVSTLKALRQELPETLLKEANEIGDMLRDRVAFHTPVAKRIEPDTGRPLGESGHLKRSWRKVPAKREGEDRYSTGVETKVDYATYVNDGTRAHIIEPKAERRAHNRQAALRFWSNGELLFRRRVHHPGTRGRFMVQRGAMDVEREYPQRAEARFRILARQVEMRGEQDAKREP